MKFKKNWDELQGNFGCLNNPGKKFMEQSKEIMYK